MSANVRDIESLQSFRAALIKFADELASVLDGIQIEIQRSVAWIEQDRPFYWNVQSRKAYDQVANTRTALTTCQMRTVAGRRPSCIEEKVAYDKAKRRLQHCQDQIKHVQSWATKLRRESDEFRGRLAPLQRLLEGDIPKMVGLLERMMTILEAYAEVARPTTGSTSAPAEGDAP